MAEKSEGPAKVGREQIPVSPAPTRSQANLQSRAPVIERAFVAAKAGETPPASAKPPPETPVNGWRRGDVVWIPIEIPKADELAPSRPEPEVCEESPKQRRRWRLSAVAAWIALAVICIVTGGTARSVIGTTCPPSRAKPYSVSKRSEPGGWGETQAGTGSASDADSAMAAALDDLDTALERIPEKSPEQILKQVSRPGQDCMLAWTNNLPSIIFGKEPILPNSLAGTLEQCAEAVSRMADGQAGKMPD